VNSVSNVTHLIVLLDDAYVNNTLDPCFYSTNCYNTEGNNVDNICKDFVYKVTTGQCIFDT